jgi:hypothetical protein
VVCATSEVEAANMHPKGGGPLDPENRFDSWANRPEEVIVILIGRAEDSVKIGVVCASYNVG